MSTATEYAKLVTHYPTPTTIFGLRTVITIPTNTSVGVNESTNGNGYIDAYLSLDRKTGHYECGLSQTAGQAGHYGLNNTPSTGKWHYFTAPSGDGAALDSAYNLSPGQEVPIEFVVNSDGTMSFKVNNVVVQTYAKYTVNDGITNARLVIGVVDQDYVTTASIPPSPLTKWGSYTDQIACNNYSYQAVQGGPWILITPGTVNQVKWPAGSTHQTVPQDFVVSKGNGYLIASLKNPNA